MKNNVPGQEVKEAVSENKTTLPENVSASFKRRRTVSSNEQSLFLLRALKTGLKFKETPSKYRFSSNSRPSST